MLLSGPAEAKLWPIDGQNGHSLWLFCKCVGVKIEENKFHAVRETPSFAVTIEHKAQAEGPHNGE